VSEHRPSMILTFLGAKQAIPFNRCVVGRMEAALSGRGGADPKRPLFSWVCCNSWDQIVIVQYFDQIGKIRSIWKIMDQ
jgi:hypothetical protein